jgi:transcriptional regulator with XRE-family HTH domain
MPKTSYFERKGVPVDVDAFKGNLRALRKHLGQNDVEFGKLLGVTPGAVRMWESGKSVPSEDRVDELLRIARNKHIDLDPSFLFSGKGEAPEWFGQDNFRRHRPRAPFRPSVEEPAVEMIPVKATLDNGDGSITISDEIERAAAPRNLAGRSGAYGLFVPNDDMAPLLRYGDVAWVDTLLPPGRDMEVVVESPDGTAAIGTVAMLTKDKIVLEVWQPERHKIELNRAEAKVHRIVGKEARR